MSIFGDGEEGVFLASLRSLGSYSCNNIATSLDTFLEKKEALLFQCLAGISSLLSSAVRLLAVLSTSQLVDVQLLMSKWIVYIRKKYLDWKR